MQQIPLTNFSQNQAALWEAPIHATWLRKIIEIFVAFNSYAKSMLNATSFYVTSFFYDFKTYSHASKLTKT